MSAAFWTLADYDDHEAVHVMRDATSNLTAIVAVHSTHRGPAAGGTRFWHYAAPELALTDALRLSRGMSYKNALAGLDLGGGKAVILADSARTKTPAMLDAFGKMIESLGGQYVTAEDVGMTEADMQAIRTHTRHVCGLPGARPGQAGGDPGPFTAQGVYLGVLAAIKQGLGKDSAQGVHVAVQGLGSVGGGVARRLAADGAKLTLADIDTARTERMARELGAETAEAADILSLPADVISPNALGGVWTAQSIAALQAPIIAGGANNQLATAADGQSLHDRGVIYAPDYVINAGGIINVGLEYLAHSRPELGDVDAVMAKIADIPPRLREIWADSKAQNQPASVIADAMARVAIGRA